MYPGKESQAQKALNQEGKATLKKLPLNQQFDAVTTQCGHIIQTLLEEQGTEKFTVIQRLWESIQWMQKAKWSYVEFAKEGRLGTRTLYGG